MTAPVFESGSVAQALYTWSKTRVDGTRGLGFVAVSPLLVGSIDWLSKLQFPEFQLVQDNTDDSLDSYESRQGFSEIGRISREHVGILYCKTADGTVDASQRPQPVVHAFFGNSKDLGLLCVDRIPQSVWIRRVKNTSSGSLRLPDDSSLMLLDSKVSDICPFVWAPMQQHACPQDHDNARQLLRLVAERSMDLTGSINVSFDPSALMSVGLAFPADISNGFSLTPYVAVNGTRRELDLRVPELKAADRNGVSQVTANAEVKCQFQQSITRAANKFLYVKEPSLRLYAKAVLDLTGNTENILLTKLNAESSSSREGLKDSVGEFDAVLLSIREVRDGPGEGPLTQRESLVLARSLHGAGFDVSKLLRSPPELLETVFGEVSGRKEILEWSRFFPGNFADSFVRLWNGTGLAFFLGLTLLKSLDVERGQMRVAAKTGVSEESTRSVLRDMMHYDDGNSHLRRILQMGLGDSENMRKFICKTFEDDPKYLYDAILAEASLPRSHMLDYIRFNFNLWKEHRHLSMSEEAAIQEFFKPGLLRRLKIHLGLGSSDGEE